MASVAMDDHQHHANASPPPQCPPTALDAALGVAQPPTTMGPNTNSAGGNQPPPLLAVPVPRYGHAGTDTMGSFDADQPERGAAVCATTSPACRPPPVPTGFCDENGVLLETVTPDQITASLGASQVTGRVLGTGAATLKEYARFYRMIAKEVGSAPVPNAN